MEGREERVAKSKGKLKRLENRILVDLLVSYTPFPGQWKNSPRLEAGSSTTSKTDVQRDRKSSRSRDFPYSSIASAVACLNRNIESCRPVEQSRDG